MTFLLHKKLPKESMDSAMTAADKAIRNFLENLVTKSAAKKVPERRMKLVKMAAKYGFAATPASCK